MTACRMIMLVLASAAITLPTAVRAADQPPAAERLICKRVVPVGTNARPKKDCRTRQSWDETRRNSQEGLADYRAPGWGADNPSARPNQAEPMLNGVPF